MPDEHNAFDLAKLLRENYPDPTDLNTLQRIDTSGRPAPVNVRVKLNSGIEVKCDVRYGGTVPNARLFYVIAEIDWENYFPTHLIVEEMPNDVEFRFRVPGMTDADADRAASRLQLVPDRIIYV